LEHAAHGTPKPIRLEIKMGKRGWTTKAA